MNKNITAVLYVILILFCVCGCTKKEEKNYYDFKKVTDYLYEVSYNDYKFDTNLETITNVEQFGCSSVKNGDYYGRNFDFIFNDVPEYVVKVNANENRHASIGVAILSGIHNNEDIENKYQDKMKLIPNFTLDGINDAGVVCSDNVVPKNDTTPITGTNPNGEKLHIGFIVRYVLDNASSADNAIELLKSRNIYGDLGDNYNLHIMIADKDKTYVVEFIDNKMVAVEKKGNEQIMTNYYVNLDYLTENSAGVERYNVLKENYNEGSSFEGMWNLMQRVQYSKVYLFDREVEWYSEFLPQSVLTTMNDENKKEYDKLFEDYKKGYWVARTYDERNPANLSYWFTTHNSTYDIKNKKLRVTVQEKYNKYYEYNL